MAEIYRLDKIAVVHDNTVVAAVVHSIGAVGMELRLVNGGYESVLWVTEGTLWARGYEGPAVNALYTVNAINNPPEPDDDDYWEGNT